MGIKFEALSRGKGAGLTRRVVKHLMNEKFDFRPDLMSEYIGCEQMPAFLNLVRTTKWIDELFPVSCKCITAQNLEQYKPYFGQLPKFLEKVIEGIQESIERASGNIQQIPIEELAQGGSAVDSIALFNRDYPYLVLNVEGPIEEGVSYFIEYPNGKLEPLFSDEIKAVYISESVGYVKVITKNTKASGFLGLKSTTSKAATISVFDCPPGLNVHLNGIIKNPALRDRCLESIEPIAKGKGSWDDYTQVLGASLIKFVGQDQKLDRELELLAVETAKFYFSIAQPYYSSKRFDRIKKDLYDKIEELARDSINSY